MYTTSTVRQHSRGLATVAVLAGAVSVVTGLKCITSVDVGLKWTVDCSHMNLSVTPSPLSIHPVVLLILSHNAFVHLKSSQFVNWTGISRLDLSFNKIETVDEGSFKGLSELSELNLMNNQLEVVSPNITKFLPKLRILNMSSNKLKVIVPGSFEPLPSLLKLYLGNNIYLGKILCESFSDFMYLTNLVSLDLTNTSLFKFPEDFISNTSRLVTLNIGYNPLNTLPSTLSSLRNLNISGALFENIPSGLLSECDALKRISLENMPLLKEIKSNAFSKLINLEELYIKNCPKLESVSEDVFGENRPKLKHVTISNSALTSLGKTLQPLLAQAQDLDLQGNLWICDGRISWIVDLDLKYNLTSNLRCDKPSSAHGMLLTDYFRPRRPHSVNSLLQAGIIVAVVAVLVASVVGMIRQSKKEKPKIYHQLQDIRLQDRSSLPPL